MVAGTVFSGPYEIASYTGTLTGSFAEVTPGYTVSYSQPGEILVTADPPLTSPLPEPSGGLLCASLCFLLARMPEGPGAKFRYEGSIATLGKGQRSAKKEEFWIGRFAGRHGVLSKDWSTNAAQQGFHVNSPLAFPAEPVSPDNRRFCWAGNETGTQLDRQDYETSRKA